MKEMQQLQKMPDEAQREGAQLPWRFPTSCLPIAHQCLLSAQTSRKPVGIEPDKCTLAGVSPCYRKELVGGWF